MGKTLSLTEGNIFKSLVKFSIPVILAMLLQAMYSASFIAVFTPIFLLPVFAQQLQEIQHRNVGKPDPQHNAVRLYPAYLHIPKG